jgi:hypothetical protein
VRPERGIETLILPLALGRNNVSPAGINRYGVTQSKEGRNHDDYNLGTTFLPVSGILELRGE